MPTTEIQKGELDENARSLLSENDQRSVNILNSLQGCDWFKQDGEEVQLLYRNPEGKLVTLHEGVPVEEFLTAVDYYQENRDHVASVSLAMKEPNGVVPVYSPSVEGGSERKVVTTIKNYMVPQILEFAYLILRSSVKEN